MGIAGLTWMEQGLCPQVDPELFFPEMGGTAEPAKRVCANCPVAVECLQYAMDNPVLLGIWGGTSVNDRRDMAAAAGRGYSPVLTSPFAGPVRQCGTEAAAARHRRAGETCDICRVRTRAAA